MKRRLLAVALLTPVIGVLASLGWYAVGRVLSPGRAVKVRESPAAQTAMRRPQETLRIVTYNICHARGNDFNLLASKNPKMLDRRLKGIALFLKDSSPDIAVLNEVDFDSLFTGRMDQAAYLAREAGFQYWVEQRNIDVDAPAIYTERFGNVVFSRFPIKRAQQVRFPPYRHWEAMLAGRADAVLCELELPEGRPLRLLAAQLESRSESTRVESALLIDEIRKSAPSPFLVVGDMNSTPKGFPESQSFQGRNALSLLLESGGYVTSPMSHPGAQDMTGRVAGKRAVIDWVLVPASWRVISRRVLPLPWSDHKAVVMEAASSKKPISDKAVTKASAQTPNQANGRCSESPYHQSPNIGKP